MEEIKIKLFGVLRGSGIDMVRRVYHTNGLAPTITTMGGGNTEPKIMIEKEFNEPIALDEQNGYLRKDGTVVTLTTDGSSPKHNNRVLCDYRVRKLTPKECWRLMGFDDESFSRAEKVVSNSQLYKQAGNSIVVNVLMAIFKNLF